MTKVFDERWATGAFLEQSNDIWEIIVIFVGRHGGADRILVVPLDSRYRLE